MKPWKIGPPALIGAVSLAMVAAAVHAADVGKPAGDYTITLLDRQTVSSADLKGKVVVVNRWATWCTPCKAEMAAFENYYRTHPDTDLKIYAVTVELEYPSRKLQPLQGILHYPLATAISGRNYRQLAGVPTSYVIDRSGVVRYAAAGAFTLESFDAFITPLLKQTAPQAVASAAPARP
jgi:cytochrome c biogenesis protein CcmG, thiol:disulfide interchange protein DsbE